MSDLLQSILCLRLIHVIYFHCLEVYCMNLPQFICSIADKHLDYLVFGYYAEYCLNMLVHASESIPVCIPVDI